MCYFWVHLLSCGADRMIFGGGDGRKGCQKANNFHSKLWQRSGKTISSTREFSIFQVCLNIHRWQVGLKQNCEVENFGFRAFWVNQSPAIYWAPSLHAASCFGGWGTRHRHPVPALNSLLLGRHRLLHPEELNSVLNNAIKHQKKTSWSNAKSKYYIAVTMIQGLFCLKLYKYHFL